jgi:DNA-binding HxlR family transcriptional regulator
MNRPRTADLAAPTVPKPAAHRRPIWEEQPGLFQACPINASVGVLGRKWSLNILRDLAFSANCRFTQFLAVNPGLSDRMLSLRLSQLIDDGLIRRDGPKKSGEASYELTAKGRDVIPILIGFVRYGMLHHATEVFRDGRPRELATADPAFWDLLREFPSVPPTRA